jgi:2-hydroxy-3-keto-5-methylthiopentenyl-1-phosphate phosphatase
MKIALLYDFDKTLSYKDMQEYGFFDDLQIEDAKTFWEYVKQKAEKEEMDHILTYLHEMIVQTQLRGIKLSRDLLGKYGSHIEFYPGVNEWFEHINQVALEQSIELEHYIISSGLKEIIEHTPIASYFKKIYACEYLYDDNGQAIWPKLSVNYTIKTQFLYRINKGILEINNDSDLNRYQKEEDRPIPFSHMIYIGDGFTDVPSMKLVKMNGGHAIAVVPYGKKTTEESQTLYEDRRVDFVCEADYRKGQEIDQIIQAIFKSLVAKKHLDELKP